MFQGRGDTHGFQMTLRIFEVFFLFNLFVISFQFCDETQTHLQLFISVPFFLVGGKGEKRNDHRKYTVRRQVSRI